MVADQVERVAEAYYQIRPMIVKTLKNTIINNEDPFVREKLLNSNNYYEYWHKTYNDMFYDMGTFIRLGSAIELGLKHYYMGKKGYTTLLELKKDIKIKGGIFQRIKDVEVLYCIELGYDLSKNTKLNTIKEIMIHRHLYAHNSGILDDKYLDDYKALTGTDVLKLLPLSSPLMEDRHFFEPLHRLNHFIEETRGFFYEFPVK